MWLSCLLQSLCRTPLLLFVPTVLHSHEGNTLEPKENLGSVHMSENQLSAEWGGAVLG